ncbi:WD40 repeat-like protein [Basidiobolus meristosporus CBS 931.73]|uniref:WD40 repeat-like protein n=1 Tax=Basidiobolus meristosporus CBS 931.73 TaxID=1314790 RepID=A0A1Y1X3Y5_9FUNG|nr:WD40 repeat-like protein [Basidiobolus meristosporus CBS 931.73]|eukprot:ORX80348.1 WD40 repeat-like protein [Basidiobolus meristosporus CBS 931.73]
MPSFTKVHPRFAHSEGSTVVAYGTTGDEIITGGTDSLCRVFKTSPEERDSEAALIDGHTEAVTCIDALNSQIATGCEDNAVRLFSHPSLKMETLVTRCTLPIRSVSFNPNGLELAVASDEQNIKIVNLMNISDIRILKGHGKGLQAVSFHPKGGLLASLDCDGTVKIWDLNRQEEPLVKTLTKISTSSDAPSGERVSLQWHPDGKYLAVPGKNKDILILSTENWTTSHVLNDGHSSNVSVLRWSPNGKYLISSAVDCQVLVWEMERKVTIASQKHSATVSDIAWHPRKNTVSYVDTMGQLMTWDNVISVDKNLPDPVVMKKEKSNDLHGMFDDDVVAELEEKEEEELVVLDESDMDSFIDDEEMGKKRHQVFNPIPTMASADIYPLQPGNTPYQANHRYLAFNMTGVIISIDQGDHATVTVEFHDKSTHRGFHFSDPYKYSHAYLGKRGALFAVKSHDEVASTVFYRPFESWATKSEWTVQLPPGEDAELIALTSKGAVVVTSKNYVRLFSYSGIQTWVFSTLPVISIAAYDQHLLLAHGNQNDNYSRLTYTLYNVEIHKIIQQGDFPLSSSAQLAWLDFSDIGHPVSYDDEGVLRILENYQGSTPGNWVPVLDSQAWATSQNKQETYWAVGVTESQFMCVVCKGETEYPQFPKPIISELNLQIPLLHLDSQMGELEERVMRGSIMAKQVEQVITDEEELEIQLLKRRTEMDKYILQLIQTACKTDRIQKALELVTLLHLPQHIDAAIKIAVFHRLSALAERMNLVKEARLIEEQQKQERSIDYQPREITREVSKRDPSRTAIPSIRSIRHQQREVSSSPQLIESRPNTSETLQQEDIALPDSNEDTQLQDFGSPTRAKSARRPVTKTYTPKKAQPSGKGGNPFAVVSPRQSHDIDRTNSFFEETQENMTKDDGLDQMSRKRKTQSTLAGFAFKPSSYSKPTALSQNIRIEKKFKPTNDDED